MKPLRTLRDCPIPGCNARYLVKLSNHLTGVHNLSVEERRQWLQRAKLQSKILARSSSCSSIHYLATCKSKPSLKSRLSNQEILRMSEQINLSINGANIGHDEGSNTDSTSSVDIIKLVRTLIHEELAKEKCCCRNQTLGQQDIEQRVHSLEKTVSSLERRLIRITKHEGTSTDKQCGNLVEEEELDDDPDEEECDDEGDVLLLNPEDHLERRLLLLEQTVGSLTHSLMDSCGQKSSTNSKGKSYNDEENGSNIQGIHAMVISKKSSPLCDVSPSQEQSVLSQTNNNNSLTFSQVSMTAPSSSGSLDQNSTEPDIIIKVSTPKHVSDSKHLADEQAFQSQEPVKNQSQADTCEETHPSENKSLKVNQKILAVKYDSSNVNAARKTASVSVIKHSLKSRNLLTNSGSEFLVPAACIQSDPPICIPDLPACNPDPLAFHPDQMSCNLNDEDINQGSPPAKRRRITRSVVDGTTRNQYSTNQEHGDSISMKVTQQAIRSDNMKMVQMRPSVIGSNQEASTSLEEQTSMKRDYSLEIRHGETKESASPSDIPLDTEIRQEPITSLEEQTSKKQNYPLEIRHSETKESASPSDIPLDTKIRQEPITSLEEQTSKKQNYPLEIRHAETKESASPSDIPLDTEIRQEPITSLEEQTSKKQNYSLEIRHAETKESASPSDIPLDTEIRQEPITSLEEQTSKKQNYSLEIRHAETEKSTPSDRPSNTDIRQEASTLLAEQTSMKRDYSLEIRHETEKSTPPSDKPSNTDIRQEASTLLEEQKREYSQEALNFRVKRSTFHRRSSTVTTIPVQDNSTQLLSEQRIQRVVCEQETEVSPSASRTQQASPKPSRSKTPEGGISGTLVDPSRMGGTSDNPSIVKLPPSKPILNALIRSKGIGLSWNMELNSSHAPIKHYEIFYYQEDLNRNDATPDWKNIASIEALPLPMACTLSDFIFGRTYHFAAYAVDLHGRRGEMSDAATITLTYKS